MRLSQILARLILAGSCLSCEPVERADACRRMKDELSPLFPLETKILEPGQLGDLAARAQRSRQTLLRNRAQPARLEDLRARFVEGLHHLELEADAARTAWEKKQGAPYRAHRANVERKVAHLASLAAEFARACQ